MTQRRREQTHQKKGIPLIPREGGSPLVLEESSCAELDGGYLKRWESVLAGALWMVLVVIFCFLHFSPFL